MTIEEKIAHKSLDIDEAIEYTKEEGNKDAFIPTMEVHNILENVKFELEKCNCERCKKVIRRLGY